MATSLSAHVTLLLQRSCHAHGLSGLPPRLNLRTCMGSREITACISIERQDFAIGRVIRSGHVMQAALLVCLCCISVRESTLNDLACLFVSKKPSARTAEPVFRTHATARRQNGIDIGVRVAVCVCLFFPLYFCFVVCVVVYFTKLWPARAHTQFIFAGIFESSAHDHVDDKESGFCVCHICVRVGAHATTWKFRVFQGCARARL